MTVNLKDGLILSTETRRRIAAMQDAACKSKYAYQQIEFLSNHIGPRLSGSLQAEAAVEYVEKQMRDLGLEARLEPVMVPHWVRGTETAQLVRYPGQVDGSTQKIVVTALGNSVATPEEGLTAAVLVVNDFDQFGYIPADEVKGKVVLFNYPFDDSAAYAGNWEQAYNSAVRYRMEGPFEASKKNAAAVLVRSTGSGHFRLAHTGLTKYKEGAAPIPAAAIPAEDADLIARLTKHGQVLAELRLTPRNLGLAQSYNVVADRKGSRFPEQVVIVSAHLDSWDLGTGALDDAAGVGIAMDVIRIIQEIAPHPQRTIRFVGWMNEENGSAGGRAYAQDHQSELPDHIAAIEIDYGDGRPMGLKVAATDERMAQIYPILKEIGDPIGGIVKVDGSPAVDLRALNQAGVPAIAPLQDARHYFDFHHSAADTLDKIRIEEIRKVVEVITPLVHLLAEEGIAL